MNGIISEEDENNNRSDQALLNNDIRCQEYYQWINENAVDFAGSETYSPSSILNKNGANKSTSSTDSASHSPPFPVLSTHNIYDASSLTMVSTRIPHEHQQQPQECMSSNGSTTSSGCSSYESKTLRTIGKLKNQQRQLQQLQQAQYEYQDYENLKYLPKAAVSKAGSLRFSKPQLVELQHPIYQTPLGSFKQKLEQQRFDYV